MSAEVTRDPFDAILDLADRMGVRDIHKLPNCYELQLDGAWWFSINAHGQERTNSKGHKQPAGTCYVEYNGWPAGEFPLTFPGGWFAAHPDPNGANQDSFVRALDARKS